MILTLTLIFILTHSVLNEEINLAGIFDENEIHEKAFRYAIDSSNKALEEDKFTLAPLINNDNIEDDSFVAQKIVCYLLKQGVVAMFGPRSTTSVDAIQSVCDAKEIPHIITKWNYFPLRDGTEINFYPHSELLSHAYFDIITAWGWKSFTALYEDDESFLRLFNLIKMAKDEGILVNVQQLDEHNTGNYKPILKQVKNSGQKFFVLDCQIDHLKEVLSQFQQVGLITNEYNFFITNLDAHTEDLTPFQYGESNITGIRLLNPENAKVILASEELYADDDSLLMEVPSWKIRTETALVIDAVHMFSIALNDRWKQSSVPIVTNKNILQCDTADSWDHGYSVINMLKTSTYEGLTGPIKFNNEGFRSDFLVNIFELREGGVTDVGNWNSSTGLNVTRLLTVEQGADEDSLRNKTFTVIITLTDPYGMYKATHETLEGNDRFEGYGIDLIQKLSEMEGFNYTFIVREDKKNGAIDPVTGRWSGMIGDLLEHRADLAITDFTITSERSQAVDFTVPFMNLGITILFRKPSNAPPSFFSFADPFALDTWIALAISFFVVSLSLFIMGRMCPDEWTNPYPCIEDPEYNINQFSLANSIWFVTGSLMCQGSEIAPIAMSTRMVAGMWWFFCLLIVASYTANLAAFLATENPMELFKDLQSLYDNAPLHGITYGSKYDGATEHFFTGADGGIFEKIGKYMKEHPENQVMENDAGVSKAENELYAFFMESTSIEYVIQRHCDLQQYGGLLDEKGYGIAMRKTVLSDARWDDSEDTIQYATDLINSATDIEIKINLVINRTFPNQPFEAKVKTCNFLKKGIVAVLGPKSPDNIQIVESICNSKDVPFLPFKWVKSWSTSIINFHPRPEQLTDAYVDILSALGWKELTILCTNFKSILNEGEFIQKAQRRGIYVYTEHLSNLQNLTYIKTVLRRIRNSGQKYFVIDSTVNELGEILDQSRESGLLTEEYKYFIANINANFQILQLFRNSGAKIIWVQLMDPSSPDVNDVINTVNKLYPSLNWYLTSEEALIVDALNILAATLNGSSILPVPLSCNKQDDWKDGSKLLNEITSESYSGLTGTIEFDGDGFRKSSQLHIFEIDSREKKLGTWNSSGGLIFLSPDAEPIVSLEDDSLVNKHLVVEMVAKAPFLMLKENGEFEGYAVELIRELSIVEGFNYTITIRDDGLNGGYDIDSEKWTGMVGDIVDGTADLAISDMTITSERMIAVDFTQPFMVVGLGILFQKPEALSPDFFSFTNPFSADLWRAIGLSFVVVTLSLFIIGRLCSSEWQPICSEHPDYLQNQLSFTNCLLFTAGGIFRQNSQIKLKSIPARIVAGSWWFACFFFITMYIANLISYQVEKTHSPLFTDIRSLVENADVYGIRYGALAHGSTEQFFKYSENELFQKISRRWAQHPEDMAASTEELIQRSANGSYAAFMESSVIEYAVNTHCNLQLYGNVLDSKGYGIAMRRESPYFKQIDRSLVQLSLSGKLTELKKKWWEDEIIKEPCAFDNEVFPLSIIHIFGVIMVTIVGIILAMFITIIQFYRHISRLRRKTGQPLSDIIRNELKKVYKRKIKRSVNISSPASNGANVDKETSEL